MRILLLTTLYIKSPLHRADPTENTRTKAFSSPCDYEAKKKENALYITAYPYVMPHQDRVGWVVCEVWVDGWAEGWEGLRVGFIDINDMYNNDVGKGGAQGCEAYEVK